MYYLKLETCTDNTISQLWDILNNAKPDDWWRENNFVEWRVNASPSIFANDIQTKYILDTCVESRRCYIQRLEPNSCFNWHTDYNRDASLTMCLNVYDRSYTLFGQEVQGTHIRDLHPLYYQKNTMYLIDGTKPHCGINLSTETRYLVSMSLTRPYTLPVVLRSLKEKFPELYKDHI